MRTADAQSVSTKIGRNDLCPCGSGRKHKKCCYGKYADAQLFDAAPAMPPHAKRRKAQALRNAASEHWRSQRYAAAALPLYEITSLTPDSPQAHYELGLCLLKCGRTTVSRRSTTRRSSPIGKLRRASFSPSSGSIGTTRASRPSGTSVQSKPQAFGKRDSRSTRPRLDVGGATSRGSRNCVNCCRSRPRRLSSCRMSRAGLSPDRRGRDCRRRFGRKPHLRSGDAANAAPVPKRFGDTGHAACTRWSRPRRRKKTGGKSPFLRVEVGIGALRAQNL